MSEKIKPALTAEEWQNARTPDGVAVGDDAWVLRLNEGGCTILTEFRTLFVDIEHIEGLIAIANDALPDDDPRKITRGKIAILRKGIGRIDLHTTFEEENALRRVLWLFADALESYLPAEE